MKKDVSIATHSAIIPLQISCFMHGLLQEGQSLSSNPQLRLLRLNGLGFDQISYADVGH